MPMSGRTAAGVVALVLAALWAVPSQSEETGGRRHHGREAKTGQQPKKADDKGYNAALSRIPSQKYDPWGGLRK
jgi:hypothetical protein